MKVLVIAPHPDDETLCCAGTIMNFIEKGDKVKIVIVTDGRYGSLDEKLRGTEELVKIRKEETIRVFKLLGVEDYEFLNFEDSKVPQKRKEVEEKLAEILKNYNPDIVFAPAPFDSHPDHSEVGKIVRRLFPNAYFYLFWVDSGDKIKKLVKNEKVKKTLLKLFPFLSSLYSRLFWKYPKEGEIIKFGIRDKKEKKKRALEVYKSQINDLKKFLPISKFVKDYEVFYKLKEIPAKNENA